MNVSNFFISSYVQNPEGMQLLGSATLTGAANTISIVLPFRTYVHGILCVPDKSNADILAIRFNDDTDAHYSWRAADLVNPATQDNSDSEIEIFEQAMAGGHMTVFDVYNTATDWKRVIAFTNNGGTVGVSAPQSIAAFGVWNQAAAVTKITFFTTGGETMNAGTMLRVYGAN